MGKLQKEQKQDTKLQISTGQLNFDRERKRTKRQNYKITKITKITKKSKRQNYDQKNTQASKIGGGEGGGGISLRFAKWSQNAQSMRNAFSRQLLQQTKTYPSWDINAGPRESLKLPSCIPVLVSWQLFHYKFQLRCRDQANARCGSSSWLDCTCQHRDLTQGLIKKDKSGKEMGPSPKNTFAHVAIISSWQLLETSSAGVVSKPNIDGCSQYLYFRYP